MRAAALLLLVPGLIAAQSPTAGKLSRAGVVRAQAVVDSVFIDRKASEGTIEAGDWASYLMARLGVEPLPDTTGMLVTSDSSHILVSGRIRDLPEEARAMLGPLAALVDANTVLEAEVVLLQTEHGLAHFQLRSVSVGGFGVPFVVLHAMLLDVGKRYPALTESGRDLWVQIPLDGRVVLISGAVRITAPRPAGGQEFSRT